MFLFSRGLQPFIVFYCTTNPLINNETGDAPFIPLLSQDPFCPGFQHMFSQHCSL